MESFAYTDSRGKSIELYPSLTGGLYVQTMDDYCDVIIPWDKVPELIDFLKRRIGTD